MPPDLPTWNGSGSQFSDFRNVVVATHRFWIRRFPRRLRARCPRHCRFSRYRCARRLRHDLCPGSLTIADVRRGPNHRNGPGSPPCDASGTSSPSVEDADASAVGSRRLVTQPNRCVETICARISCVRRRNPRRWACPHAGAPISLFVESDVREPRPTGTALAIARLT